MGNKVMFKRLEKKETDLKYLIEISVTHKKERRFGNLSLTGHIEW